MELNHFYTPEEAAIHIYASTLKSSPLTIAMITLFLKGKTSLEVSQYLNVPYPNASHTRYRFRELINAYLKHESISLPTYL